MRYRKVISISIAPKTIENFDYVTEQTGLSRGQTVDWLVEKEMKKLKKLAGSEPKGSSEVR